MRSLLTFILLLLATIPAGAQAPVAITHVNVVDLRDGSVRRNRTLVIQNGQISMIRHGRIPVPPDWVRVDGTGKFAIPGLWDMHYHFANSEPHTREYNLLLANGVLGIRDMGDKPEKIFAARNAIAAGKVLGPRIFACGPIVDGPNPTNPPLSVSVQGAEDGRATVHRLKAMGADCVKVHDGVSLESYLAIAAESRKVGLPLVGHVPPRVRILQATNAGQRSIEHQIGLRGGSTAELEVMAAEQSADVFGEAVRTRNFQLIPESIAKKENRILDTFSAERSRDLYRAFARNGTYLVPTLVTNYSLTFVDDLVRTDDARTRYVPAAQREWWDPTRGMLTRYRTPAYIAFRKRQFQKTLEQIPVAHRAGVRFLAGTDTTLPFVYPGFSVHDEMRWFVKAGLTPLQALQTATINPARFLGVEDSCGTLRPGRAADFVLLDANPLEEIGNTQKIFAVVVAGKVLTRDQLDEMLKAAEAAARQ